MKQHHVIPFAWILTAAAAALGVLAWYQSLLSPLGKLTIYDIFPVFGILAFSLMWAHYMVGVSVRLTDIDRSKLKPYMTITSMAVLFALLLHPGLLIWQMWRDGLGLPINYVAPDLRLFVVLGQIAFLMFMAYELHRRYENRSWWHYIERLSDVAMILILIHGFKLSATLYPDWFRWLWVFYAFTYVAAIANSAAYRYHHTGKIL